MIAHYTIQHKFNVSKIGSNDRRDQLAVHCHAARNTYEDNNDGQTEMKTKGYTDRNKEHIR